MSQAPTLVVYHNARCSKSRAACQLIAEHGAEARIVNYLETPPSRETLPSGLTLLVPVIEPDQTTSLEELPPWKR